MAKESVIVFDGEDKFIAPREKEFDKIVGFANVVGQNDTRDVAAPVTPQDEAPTPTPSPAQMALPVPSDADFCERAEAYIRTNGGGSASPSDIMEVANNFRANCQRPPSEVRPELLTVNWSSLSCDEIDAKIREIQDFLAVVRIVPEERSRYEASVERGMAAKTEKCGVTPPSLPDVPPTPTPTPTPKPTPILAGLGIPPSKGGAAGGGGGEKPQEKKKSNLWIWLLVAAGAYLLLSGDKKN
jgi:hypothetical protein